MKVDSNCHDLRVGPRSRLLNVSRHALAVIIILAVGQIIRLFWPSSSSSSSSSSMKGPPWITYEMHNDNDINQHYTSSMPDEIDWLLSNAGGGGKRDGSGLDQFRVGPTHADRYAGRGNGQTVL